MIKLKQGASLPAWSGTISVTSASGVTFPDFSSGYTFSVSVRAKGSTTVSFSKSSGITGAQGSATAASFTVTWTATGEVSDLAQGYYVMLLTATQTVGSRAYEVTEDLLIEAVS